MTKSPVNNGNRKKKVVKMKATFHPTKDKYMEKRHKIINLVHPDAAETLYGWAFKNFYDAREDLKTLSNKDTTAIGGKEFKQFNNLTMRWIKTSKLGQLLWIIRNDNDGERKFPIEAHKIYANKIARYFEADVRRNKRKM
jgi:hypothetical protein